jgi:hypothetical protein
LANNRIIIHKKETAYQYLNQKIKKEETQRKMLRKKIVTLLKKSLPRHQNRKIKQIRRSPNIEEKQELKPIKAEG